RSEGRRLFRRDVAELVDRHRDRLAATHRLGGPAIFGDRDLLAVADLRNPLAGELLADLLLGHLTDIAAVVAGGHSLRERRRGDGERRQDGHGKGDDRSADDRSAHGWSSRLSCRFSGRRVAAPYCGGRSSTP